VSETPERVAEATDDGLTTDGAAETTPRRLFARSNAARAAGPRVSIRTVGEGDGLADLPARQIIREGERRHDTLGRDTMHRRLLASADVLAASVAVLAATVAARSQPTVAVLAMPPLVVAISKIVGLYDRDEHVVRKTTLDEAPSLFGVAMGFTLLVWLGDGTLADPALGKSSVLLAGVMLFVAMGALRTLARRVALTVAPAERLLVLGSAEESTRIEDKLGAAHPLRAQIVGRVPLTSEARSSRGGDVLGVLPDLDYVLARHRIDRVVICPHGESSSDMLDTIRLVKAFGVKVSVMPRLFEVVGSSVEFDELCGLILLGMRRYDLTKSSATLKRTLDVVGATTALAVLAPLYAGIALAIRLTSSGPVLFRQPRVGRSGEPFDMLKFRTMYDGAHRSRADLLASNETDGLFKMRADPRVTPVGRWLRRCSLDELPQFINVLRGQMSLVGPRPLIPEEDARVEGWFRRRLDVTPGMTGAWQVLGSTRVPLRDMVTIDYLYRANWSLWLDVKILLRTVPHVLRRQGL
jgi:exopolysaccharide biosynthesis polyprenyl glycosylphosphotransferase